MTKAKTKEEILADYEASQESLQGIRTQIEADTATDLQTLFEKHRVTDLIAGLRTIQGQTVTDGQWTATITATIGVLENLNGVKAPLPPLEAPSEV